MLFSLTVQMPDDFTPEVTPYQSAGETVYSLALPSVHLCGLSRRHLEALAHAVREATAKEGGGVPPA